MPYIPSTSHFAAVLPRLLFILCVLLGGTTSLSAAVASSSKNDITVLNQAQITGDTSAGAEVTADLMSTGRSVSVFIWGPVMAIILGMMIAWVIWAIKEGGIKGATNGLLALIFGALSISICYKYLIAQ